MQQLVQRTIGAFRFNTPEIGRKVVLCVVALVAVALTGCVPGAGIGGGGEDGSYSTAAGSGVWVYPYGDVYTAPARVTSETQWVVAQTTDKIQITYEVVAHVFRGGPAIFRHDHDTTPFLGAGGTYSHKGDYATYNDDGVYDMTHRPLACLYRTTGFCAVAADWESSAIFEVVNDFAGDR